MLKNNLIIIELIYNLSFLVALSALSGFIDARLYRTKFRGKVLQGLLFGFTAVIGMLYPFVLQEGVIFDGRSIVISLCTLFFGPLSGFIAAAMALIFRIFLGGGGVLTGVLVISSSFLIGFIFYKKRTENEELTNLQLYVFGILVHVAMLLFMLALPSETIIQAYKKIGFTVIGIFPIITLVIGKILLDQEKREDFFNSLKKSEAKFRALADSSPAAIFIYQGEKFVYVNQTMIELTGYIKDELFRMDFWSVIHPDYKKLVKERGLKRQLGFDVETRYQFKIVRKNGDVRWVDFSGAVIEYDGKPAGLGTAYDITTRINSIENLRQQKEMFKTTLYSIGDAVITTDINSVVQQMNPVAEKLTGWKENEAQGKNLKEVFNIIDEVTRRKVENPVDEIISNGKVVGLANHTILISREGKEIPISDSGAPIRNESRGIIGVVLVFRDQTEEREADRKLKESEAKFKSLVNFAFDGIYMMNETSYNFVNDRFCQITGYDREELLSEDFDFNLLLTEQSKKVAYERYLARKRGDQLPATYELQINSKAGVIKEVELSTVSIGRVENVLVIGIMRDISERKKTEQVISKTMEALERAEEQAKLGSWSYDTVKQEGFWSKQMFRHFGLEPADAPPSFEDYFEYIHPEDRNMVRDALYNSADKKLSDLGTFRTNPLKIELKYLHPTYIQIKDNSDDVIRLEGTLLDITDKVKTEKELIAAKEKAENANELKSEFLAQVSHEIRSPLNAVINFSALIKEEINSVINDELRIAFDGIDSASRRVIRTIDLILNMSELQLGTYNVIPRRIDLVELLGSLKREYHNLAKMKNLDLRFETGLNKAQIKTDDYAAHQIFANLIDNAIKYTKSGFVKIGLSKIDAGTFRVYVEDSGIGMTNEYLDSIFDAFSQEEQGYSRRFEGSGLGMSLVQKYVDLINAKISVKSEKGKGTTFTVTLPMN